MLEPLFGKVASQNWGLELLASKVQDVGLRNQFRHVGFSGSGFAGICDLFSFEVCGLLLCPPPYTSQQQHEPHCQLKDTHRKRFRRFGRVQR